MDVWHQVLTNNRKHVKYFPAAGNIVIRVSHVKGGEMAARNVLNVQNHFKYFWFPPVLDEEKQGPDCFTYKNGQD